MYLDAYAWKTWPLGKGRKWVMSWHHWHQTMGWRGKTSFGKNQRHSRRFLQLEVISKAKLIKNEQSGLKIVVSSIELSSRYFYTPFKCSSLVGWPNSAGSIFNLKLSIWWSDESFPKGTNYYNNSIDTKHSKCSSVRKPIDKFYSQY